MRITGTAGLDWIVNSFYRGKTMKLVRFSYDAPPPSRKTYGLSAPRFCFLLIALFLLHAAIPAAAFAADYYVSTTGSDAAAGTAAAPWKTIAYAVSKMNAGDTTYVKGGVYNEQNTILFSRSGTASAPIKLLNAPGEFPVIDFVNNQKFVLISTGIPTALGYITIEGFEIRNAAAGIVIHNGDNITIRRNWIHHAKSQGIHGNGRNVMVDRNIINHNGNFAGCAANTALCNQVHGIYATGTNWVVTNNLIYDNLAWGIHVAGYAHCPQGGCWGGSVGAPPKIYAGPEYGGADGWLIANNTIAYNNYRGGIALWQGLTTNSKIINNIIYENNQKNRGTVQGIDFLGSGGGHIIQNNICYATTPGATNCI